MLSKIGISILVLVSVINAQSLYKEAKDVMAGKKSATVKTLIVQNCPYERCTDQVEGTSEVKLTVKNEGMAIALYLESMRIDGEYRSAEDILSFMSGQLDYLELKPNKFLLKNFKKKTGMSVLQYSNVVKESISFLVKEKKCSGFYWLSRFSKKGFVYKNKEGVADKLYEGQEVCAKEPQSLYSISYKGIH